MFEDDGELIVKLYKQGHTYEEIRSLTGFTFSKISKYVKGIRTKSEVRLLSLSKGRCKLSENGRLKLIENGIKSCQKSNKYYTKPEILFKNILNEIKIGVKFPEFIKENKNVVDDEGYEQYILYQYPIQRYVLDYVDVVNMIAININGDYWHANPLLYDSDNLGKLQKINVRQDKNKRIFLEKNNWKVVDIWESEIYWNKPLVIEKLRAVGITEARLDYTQEEKVQFLHCLPFSDWSTTLKKLWFKKDRKPRKESQKITKVCKCGKEFICVKREKREQKYCSKECVHRFNTNKNKPLKEELEKLIKDFSFVQLGKRFGVSDVTIKKWCKNYGIIIGKRFGFRSIEYR